MSLDERIRQLSETIIQEARGPIEAALHHLLADVMSHAAADRERAVESATAEARSAHESAIAALRDEYERDRVDVEAMRQQFERELDASQAGLRERLDGEHAAAIAALHQSLTDTHDAAIAEARESLTQEHLAALDALRAEFDQRRQAELEEWRRQFDQDREAAVADARRQVEQERDLAADTLQRQLQQEREESLAALRLELEQAKSAELEALRQQFEQAKSAELEALRQQFEQAKSAELEARREQFEQAKCAELEALRQQSEQAKSAELEALRQQLEGEKCAELEALRQQFHQEREMALAAAGSDIEREREAALAALRQGLTLEHQASLGALREDLGRAHQAALEAALASAAAEPGLVRHDRTLAAFRRLDASRSLTEVLTVLLEQTAAEVGRALLFTLGGGRLRGWGARGFEDLDAASIDTPVEDGSVFGVAVATGLPVSTADAPMSSEGVLGPAPVIPEGDAGLAVPLSVGGRVVAILYADSGGERVPAVQGNWPEIAEILSRHAAHRLEVLTVSHAATLAGRVQQSGRVDGRPAGRADDEPPQSDERREEESARRYARLLISEIKLYNEPAVAQGRESRDLLARLGRDIERARRLYEEKIPAAVRQRVNCFDHEVVRTLAGGDPDLLGQT